MAAADNLGHILLFLTVWLFIQKFTLAFSFFIFVQIQQQKFLSMADFVILDSMTVWILAELATHGGVRCQRFY